MSSSNCCFLTCIQVSQEAGQVVWYSHLFQNFPQFIVIHTVKGFGIVNKAEIDVFLALNHLKYPLPSEGSSPLWRADHARKYGFIFDSYTLHLIKEFVNSTITNTKYHFY